MTNGPSGSYSVRVARAMRMHSSFALVWPFLIVLMGWALPAAVLAGLLLHTCLPYVRLGRPVRVRRRLLQIRLVSIRLACEVRGPAQPSRHAAGRCILCAPHSQGRSAAYPGFASMPLPCAAPLCIRQPPVSHPSAIVSHRQPPVSTRQPPVSHPSAPPPPPAPPAYDIPVVLSDSHILFHVALLPVAHPASSRLPILLRSPDSLPGASWYSRKLVCVT